MTLRFLVIAEDELGYQQARDLVDRVITDRGPPWAQELWRDDLTRQTQRRWLGFEATRRWSSWADLKRLATEHSIRAHGHGMRAERLMAHKAVELVAKLTSDGTLEEVDALFLVHDTDGNDSVRELLREGAARGNGGARPFEVIVAAPHPESEAWVVAGAPLKSRKEKARRDEERQRLGFDPVTQPERLSSNRLTDKRDAKRVCEALMGPPGDGYEHWQPCWKEVPLEVLKRNAEHAGLLHFTRQIEQIILPLLGYPLFVVRPS